MKQKIVQLMKSEGLTSSRLAEILEIQPSGVSHLISGRNKPGFESLQKILRRFPNINPDWLILDSEEMYRQDSSISISDDIVEPSLSVPNSFATSDIFASISQVESQENEVDDNVFKSSKIDISAPKVSQVIVFYSDGTCRSYSCQG